jgi:hypothetical protein
MSPRAATCRIEAAKAKMDSITARLMLWRRAMYWPGRPAGRGRRPERNSPEASALVAAVRRPFKRERSCARASSGLRRGRQTGQGARLLVVDM